MNSREFLTRIRDTKRDAGIDTIAGFFVVYICIGHALALFNIPDNGVCPSSYLYFFMPWFFYKGGMYFRNKPLKKGILQDGKRLLLPYVKWSLIGFVIINGLAVIVGNQIHGIKSCFYEMLFEGSLYENKPLWFLASLFLVKTIVNFPPPSA